jgi:hypothetical protein
MTSGTARIQGCCTATVTWSSAKQRCALRKTKPTHNSREPTADSRASFTTKTQRARSSESKSGFFSTPPVQPFEILNKSSGPNLRVLYVRFCVSAGAQAAHERDQTLDLFLIQIGVRRHSSGFTDGNSALFNNNPDQVIGIRFLPI